MEQFVPTFEGFTGASAILAGIEDKNKLKAQYGDADWNDEFDPKNARRDAEFNTAETFNISMRDRKLEIYLRDLLASPISMYDKRIEVEKTLTPDEIAAVYANAEAYPEKWAEYLPMLDDAVTPANSNDSQTFEF